MAPSSGQFLNSRISSYPLHNLLNSTSNLYNLLNPTNSASLNITQLESLQSQAEDCIAGLCSKMSRTNTLIVRARDKNAGWILRGRAHEFQSTQPKTIENIFFSCLGRDLTLDLSVLNQLPCHLSHHTSSNFVTTFDFLLLLLWS